MFIKILKHLICVPLAFFVLVGPAFASETCDYDLSGLDEYLYEGDVFTCFDGTSTSLGDVRRLLQERASKNKAETDWSEMVRVYVEDLVSLDVDQIELLETLGGQTFSVIVDGLCVAECSRLFLPLASNILFKNSAIVALTDSTSKSQIKFHGKNLGVSGGFISVNDFLSSIKTYGEIKDNDSRIEFILNKHSNADPIHQNWHAFFAQTINATNHECKGVKPLVIVLTPKYFSQNSLSLRNSKTYVPPNDKVMLRKVRKVLGQEAAVFRVYETEMVGVCG